MTSNNHSERLKLLATLVRHGYGVIAVIYQMIYQEKAPKLKELLEMGF